MSYIIRDNKIINLDTFKYSKVEWNISNPYENFIYNSEETNILVSNIVTPKINLGIITVDEIKLVSLPDMKMICIINTPSYVLTKIISISNDRSYILGYFYNITNNYFKYKLIYTVVPKNGYAREVDLQFSEDVSLKRLNFLPLFINDPYNSKNHICMIYSSDHFVNFSLLPRL